MNRPSRRRAAPLLMLALFPLWSPSTRASLGGGVDSVYADFGSQSAGAAAQSAAASTSLAGYDLHEFADRSGMRLREYVSRAGIVFAVAWSGPAPPDLRALLGTYFSAYSTALAALDSPGLHRSLRIESDGLVVEAGGHLRAYSGRAYLVPLFPSGVSAAELR